MFIVILFILFQWKFDFKKAASRSIERVDWENAVGFSQSEEGSGGVMFVGNS
jgi:hypothetical protein